MQSREMLQLELGTNFNFNDAHSEVGWGEKEAAINSAGKLTGRHSPTL